LDDHPRSTRYSSRRQTRSPAWISYGLSSTLIPCVLWNVSEGGARLTAAHSNILPDRFVLILNKSDQTHRLCRVVWRRQQHLGVQFVEPQGSEVRRHEPGVARALAAES
jgi:hypothetical protein